MVVSTLYRPPEQIIMLVIPSSHPLTYGRILYEMKVTFKWFTISLILDIRSCTYSWQWDSWHCQKFQSLWYCYLPFVSKWDLTALLQSSGPVAKVLGSHLRQQSVGYETGCAHVEVLLLPCLLQECCINWTASRPLPFDLRPPSVQEPNACGYIL